MHKFLLKKLNRMASLAYLYKNRARFPIFSTSFLRAWAKRFLCYPELYKRNSRRKRLIRKGARIAATAEIGKMSADGNGKNLVIGNN